MRAWETLYGFEEFTYPEKGGFLAHYHGRPFPNKGMAYSQATETNNIIKRIVTGLILCFKPTLHPVENFLSQFRRLADYLYIPHYLHTRYYNDCSRELFQFVFMWLRRLGFKFELAYGCARIPATLLEYENSYRFRVQDIAGIFNLKALLENPRKEIKRVEKIYYIREHSHGASSVADKYKMVFLFLKLALLIPNIKKAFKFALVGSEFENFKLDKADLYWANRFNDYDYNGERREERQLKQAFQIYGL